MDGQPPAGATVCSATAAEEYVTGAARALASLAPAVASLVGELSRSLPLAGIRTRGYFRPEEEAQLLQWFARFLTIRSALWELLGELSAPVGGEVARVLDRMGWRCFVLGYGTASLIVRLDQHLVEELAVHSLIQRKLNEGSARHRIPRKQFTAVFESFTDPAKARLMDQAMRFAARNRELLGAMMEDPLVGVQARELASWERVLDPSKRRYGSRLLAYLGHAMRRRGASARQNALFGALEASGRLVSELHDHWTPPALDAARRAELAALLEPGDVLVTRHERALSNLFLPGYWPHAALYVGREDEREALGVEVDEDRRRRWCGERSVLEALKDGVLFRPLAETLAVDAVAVLRPKLSRAEIAAGLGRAAEHEGKGYNFDFDFFRSDHLVCTEVVYRAYDGLGEVEIPLTERSGRPTLSAEDLLGLALAEQGFTSRAAAGVITADGSVVVGDAAAEAIAATLR